MPFRQEAIACVPPPEGRFEAPDPGGAVDAVRWWARHHGAPSPELRQAFLVVAADLDAADDRGGAEAAAGLAAIRAQTRRSWRWPSVPTPERAGPARPADLAVDLADAWSRLCLDQPRWFLAWQAAGRGLDQVRRQGRRGLRLGRKAARRLARA